MSDYQFTTGPQIDKAQLAKLINKGYRSIMCFRPDNENDQQVCYSEIEKACYNANVKFKAIPFTSENLHEHQVKAFADFFRTAEQPIYMYCGTGTRAKLIYQAAMVMGLLD